MNLATQPTPPSFIDLYRALDFERPLDVSKENDSILYVKNLHVNGDYDPMADLRASIEMADSPGTWLFTGHRGVGKSTELRCMADLLRKQDFTVWVVDMLDYLNAAEPLTIEGLLLNIAATLADEAVEQKLHSNTMQPAVRDRLQAFLKRIEINVSEFNLNTSTGIDHPNASVKLLLKHEPSLRQKILDSVRHAPAKLAEKIRNFAKEIADANGQPIVLILDSLERLRISGTQSKQCYDAIINTFDLHGQHLKLEHIHVVYSVPPYLPFLCPRIGAYFGVEICTLPHVKIFEMPQASSDAVILCDKGISLLMDCAKRRYSSIEQLIPKEQIQLLAVASSGSVRDFFRLIRSVCTKAHAAQSSIPLDTLRWVDLAKQALRNEMPLAQEDKKWLSRVRKSHGTELDAIENLHQLARLFDNGLILNYRNGKDWCEVQYLLHDVL